MKGRLAMLSSSAGVKISTSTLRWGRALLSSKNNPSYFQKAFALSGSVFPKVSKISKSLRSLVLS